MIKFALAALWISVATLGAVFLGASGGGGDADAESPAPLMGGLDFVKTEVISVPVVSAREVTGYFLTRLVYTVDPAELAKLSVPAPILLTDAVYTHLYSRPDIDIAQVDAFDVEAFRNGVRDGINARVGQTLVHDVMVEQIDFLTKDEIRNNSSRKSSASRNVRVSGKAAPEAAGDHAAPAH